MSMFLKMRALLSKLDLKFCPIPNFDTLMNVFQSCETLIIIQVAGADRFLSVLFHSDTVLTLKTPRGRGDKFTTLFSKILFNKIN